MAPSRALPMLMLVLVCGVGAARAETTPSPPAPTQRSAAVLPLRAGKGIPDGEAIARLLTNSLTIRLNSVGVYKVISADEVAALLEHETERQGLGCADDACLAEIADALGTQVVISGDVVKVPEGLLWSVRAVQQSDNAVIARASVTATNIDGLHAQVEDVAFIVSGKADALKLEGPEAARRLGFENVSDVGKFAEWRSQHPALGLSSALTTFIVDRNAESHALDVAQAAMFGLAAPLSAMACLAGSVAWVRTNDQPVSISACGCAGCFSLLSLSSVVIGLVLVIIDTVDVGRAPVKSGGCCREDAELLDVEDARGVERASTAAVFASIPVAVGLGIVGIVAPLVFCSVVFGLATNAPAEVSYYALGGFLGVTDGELAAPLGLACAGCTLGLTSTVSLVAGALRLVFSQRPLVNSELEESNR